MQDRSRSEGGGGGGGGGDLGLKTQLTCLKDSKFKDRPQRHEHACKVLKGLLPY